MDAANVLFTDLRPALETITTLLSQTVFPQAAAEGVQLHHDGNNHWLASSTVSIPGLPPGVHVFNSIRGDLSLLFKRQLAQKYSSLAGDDGVLTVRLVPVCKQTNSYDCGLYAIANCAEVLFGSDPSKVVFDPEAVRPHLRSCFVSNKLQRFPSKRKQGKPAIVKTLLLRLTDFEESSTTGSFSSGQSVFKMGPRNPGRPKGKPQLNFNKKK